MLYKVKGYAFIENNGVIEKNAITNGSCAHDYKEVQDTFEKMGIKNYMFILGPEEEEEEEK